MNAKSVSKEIHGGNAIHVSRRQNGARSWEGEHEGGGEKGVVGQMGGGRGKPYSKNPAYK